MIENLPGDSVLNQEAFLFGVATSAFQIEGAVGERRPCIWDAFCREPGKIRDGSNGDIACDHVARSEADLDLLAWLGVDAYRFSINWARFLDEQGRIDPRGLAFYDRLLDGLAERGIKPFVTLYHWELPQHLEARGGWLERDTAARFRDYAALAATRLGDRVEAWATLNEPWCSAWLGYGNGIHAPGRTGLGAYRKAGHHLLLAHGMALEALRSESKSVPVGIVLNDSPCLPASDQPEDADAARIAEAFHYRWFLEPVLAGRYPGLADELPEAQQPPIRPGDLACIGAPIDYLGLNYYTVERYRAGGPLGFEAEPPQGTTSDMGWAVDPDGLRHLLEELAERYELPPVYICENGIALRDECVDGVVDDPRRAAYLRDHLLALDEALRAGVDVRGYFHWSLLDNFEWAEGYTKRFGLVWVDYDTLERVPKGSAHALRQWLGARPGIRRGTP